MSIFLPARSRERRWSRLLASLPLLLTPAVAAQPPHRPPPPYPGTVDAAAAQEVEVLFVSLRHCTLSAEVAATIVRLPEREGDIFTRGQILVALDDTVYRAAVAKADARVKAADQDLKLLENREEAAANVAKAEARLHSATVHRQTQEGLFKDKAVSINEVEDARAAERVAQADLAIARIRLRARAREVAKARAMLAMAAADLDVARRQLQSCCIRAPFAGRVVRLLARPHERVQAGQKLVEILDDSVLEARFFFPVQMLERVHVGDTVDILVHQTGRLARSRITRVGAAVNSVTSTITVYAEYRNPKAPGKRLRSGMRGTLSLRQFRQPARDGDTRRGGQHRPASAGTGIAGERGP